MISAEMHGTALAALLAPVRAFLDDASVSEIMINGPSRVFIERAGKLVLTEVCFEDAGDVLAALRNVAQFAGTFIDEAHPVLEARLPDGSRLAAVLSPIAEGGPVVSIRKFNRSHLTLSNLVEFGTLDQRAARALNLLTLAKCNVLVSGGTGSGKTSLLNVLTALIPERERVLVLEDTREINANRAHVVYLTARPADDRGQGAISVGSLFRTSLRMRPDRIVVGELRSGEALDLVQAMVSGHGGCLTTLHASHPYDALTRLETMCMMSEVQMPLSAIRMQIASGVHVVVQIERGADGRRRISHISEVLGFDATRGQYTLAHLFVRVFRGIDPGGGGGIISELVATDAVPGFAERFSAYGVDATSVWPQLRGVERSRP